MHPEREEQPGGCSWVRGGQDRSASPWLGPMVHALCPGLPSFQCWSESPSWSLCPQSQALTLYLDPFFSPDGVFQLHPLPAAVQRVPPVRVWHLRLPAQVHLCGECCARPQPSSRLHTRLLQHTLTASSPLQDMLTFTLERREFEDGKGKCPYDPAKGHTGLLVGEWLTPLPAEVSPKTCSHPGPRGMSVYSLPFWPG